MRVRSLIFPFPLALSFLFVPVLSVLILSIPGEAQRTPATPAAASAPTAIPALVPYSGVAVAADGKPLTGEAGVTFLIFKEEQGGEPLWVESQTVAFDPAGHYKVQLGAANPNGLPSALFATGEARWLETQVAGEKPQARVLLASVPYALKAADAATLGGLPPSAFALAGTQTSLALGGAAPAGVVSDATSNVTTTGGTSGYVPVFTGSSTVGNSKLYSSSTGIGIGDVPSSTALLDVNGRSIWRGVMTVVRTGNATTSTSYPSFPMVFQASAYNSSSKAMVLPTFQFQVEPAGNNTANTGATFNFLYTGNNGTPAETGMYFNDTGTIHFAAGQTFGGKSTSGIAIDGTSTSSTGVEGTSSTGSGVVGTNGNSTLGTAGVLGVAGQRNTSGFTGIAGVWGDSSTSTGVFGSSDNANGVYGVSDQQYGVFGASNQLNGVYGTTYTSSPYYAGVYGTAGGNAIGVRGLGDSGDGVYAESAYANGVEGHATLPNGIGVVGDAYYTDGLAGQFNGNLVVTGTNSAGSANIKIDHPADPANRYLVHTAIESSEMINIYSGNVTTDELGLATVQLPGWFEIENGDFRYQLTVLSQFAQAIVKTKIANHQFTIMTNASHVEVSWQVTGVRLDAFAKAHPLVVEEAKPASDRGFYLRPELYGQPEEKQLDWARNPDWMLAKKKMREMHKSRPSGIRSGSANSAPVAGSGGNLPTKTARTTVTDDAAKTASSNP